MFNLFGNMLNRINVISSKLWHFATAEWTNEADVAYTSESGTTYEFRKRY